MLRFHAIQKVGAHSLCRIWTILRFLVVIVTFSSFYFHQKVLRLLNQNSVKTKCVCVMGYQNREGIGQTLLRNQFAVFVAQITSSKMAFPGHESEHGYNYAEVFDRCIPLAEPVLSDVNAPKAHETHGCLLRQEDLYFEQNCGRGECECLEREVMKYVIPFARRCKTIGVEHNGFKTQEYSGCIGDVIKRYLGGPNRWPMPYNAIHYRQGDLAKKRNETDFWLLQLNSMINFMCKYSDLDIIIVTEGETQIPKCGKRVVLASNMSESDAFSIMQNARWTGFGISGFALAMAQIVRPERVLMPEYAMPYYDWLLGPKWTVFTETGAAFNFRNGEEALRAIYHPEALHVRTHRYGFSRKHVHFETEVPVRRWQEEALPS